MGTAHAPWQRRRVAGILATTIDGRTWTWQIHGTLYRWCKLGHLEIVQGKTCARIQYFNTLAAAMAYTVGYHQAAYDTRARHNPHGI